MRHAKTHRKFNRRSDHRRAMLFELDESIQALRSDHPDHPSVVRLTGLYHNLLRSWAEL